MKDSIFAATKLKVSVYNDVKNLVASVNSNIIVNDFSIKQLQEMRDWFQSLNKDDINLNKQEEAQQQIRDDYYEVKTIMEVEEESLKLMNAPNKNN